MIHLKINSHIFYSIFVKPLIQRFCNSHCFFLIFHCCLTYFHPNCFFLISLFNHSSNSNLILFVSPEPTSDCTLSVILWNISFPCNENSASNSSGIFVLSELQKAYNQKSVLEIQKELN